MPTSILNRYQYDALNRQVGRTLSRQPVIQHFHCNNRLTTEIQGAASRSIVQHNEQLLALQQSQGAAPNATLLATDQQRSVLQARAGNQSSALAYTAYGHHPVQNGLLSLLGFNGERPDPVTGHYHLGNGYRQFSPMLMRFTCPDSWSPFGRGGLNAYGYCAGDPVNRTDPSGHISLKWMPWRFLGKVKKRMGGSGNIARSTAKILSNSKARMGSSATIKQLAADQRLDPQTYFLRSVHDEAVNRASRLQSAIDEIIRTPDGKFASVDDLYAHSRIKGYQKANNQLLGDVEASGVLGHSRATSAPARQSASTAPSAPLEDDFYLPSAPAQNTIDAPSVPWNNSYRPSAPSQANLSALPPAYQAPPSFSVAMRKIRHQR